jgi:hypothetical protein
MMDNFKLISMWLSGRKDYDSGVEIYNRLGRNFAVKAMIAKPENSLRLEFLIDAMRELLLEVGQIEEPKLSVEELKQEAREINIAVAHQQIKASDLPNAPEEIKAAIKLRKNLYAEFVRLHTSLNLNTPAEQRRINCLRILTIRDEIRPLWKLTNYYDDNLKLPEKATDKSIEDLSEMDANKLYEANYKYLRKFFHDDKKSKECLRRLEECNQLKIQLTNANAFFHDRLILPTLESRGSNL